jgi:hypothetical protein
MSAEIKQLSDRATRIRGSVETYGAVQTVTRNNGRASLRLAGADRRRL